MTNQDIVLAYPYYSLDDNDELNINATALTFLKNLFSQTSQTKYARIIPMDLITGTETTLIGKIQQGNINCDGKSAARRACNLTLVTSDVKNTIRNTDWALSTKFKLDIGIESNSILYDSQKKIYDLGDIVWFPQGEYIITQFNANLGVNSYTITINGQDKMALLNGTVGGTFLSQMNLSEYDQLNEQGEIISTHSVLLPDIITNVLLTYGNEDIDNIILKGLREETASNLLEYRGSTPLYMLINNKDQVVQITTYGNQPCYIDNTLTSLNKLTNYYYDTQNPGQLLKLSLQSEVSYYCRKVEYGQTAGYEAAELIYPGELNADVGATVTSVLDKIKNVYTNYEYFYDVFGRFTWQKKPNSYTVSYPEQNENGELEININSEITPSWLFSNLQVQTTFANNPVISDVKNDFTVWGKKKSTAGELPIHMRVAIQNKPNEYISPESGEVYEISDYDWHELIYQMASDEAAARSRGITLASWREQVAAANPIHYPTGVTGYEDYYLDMLTFWRKLYNPNQPVEYVATTNNDTQHGKLFLPYKYTEVNKIDNWYSGNVNDYFVNSELGNPVKWIDQYNLNNSFGNNENIYSWYNNQLQNIEQIINFENQAVYYLEQQENNKVIEKRPFNYCQERQDFFTYWDKYYYATVGQLNNKQKIICESDITMINIKDKKFINISGEQNDVNNNWTLNYQPFGIKTRVFKVKINNIEYGQDTEIETVIEKLQSEIKKTNPNIILVCYSYGELEYILNTPILCYYYRKPLNDNDIEYFLNDKNEYELLIDTLYNKTATVENKKPRRNWLFKSENSIIRPYTEDEITNEFWQDDRTYCKIIPNKQEGTTKVTTIIYTPTLNSISFNKSLVYKSDRSLLDYENLLNAETRTLYQKTQEWIEVSDEQPPATEINVVYDWTGYATALNEQTIIYYYRKSDYQADSYWNTRLTIEEPYNKLFWLDFIEPIQDKWYSQFAKEKIGKRPKATNDSMVTAINYLVTPSLQLNTEEFPLPDRFREYFVLSSQGKSAQEAIDEQLSKYTFCAESVSTQILPVYILEPNQIIEIHDPNTTGIKHQYYSINSLTIPLTYNGMMSLNLTRIFKYDDEN